MQAQHSRIFFAPSSILGVCLGLVLCLASCKDDKPRKEVDSATMLRYLPSFSTFVVGVSWSRVQESELFTKYKDWVLNRADKELKEMKKCGIDFLTELESVVIAANDINDGDSFVIALKGRFTQKQIEGCYRSQGGTIREGVYTGMGDDINVYWPNANTVILSSTQSSKALEENGKTGGLTGNPRIMKLVSKVRPNAALWAAGLIPAGAGGPIANLRKLGAAVPEEGYFSMVMDSKVSIQIGMVFTDSQTAKGFDQLFKTSLASAKLANKPPGITTLLSDVESITSDSTVMLNVQFSEEQLKALSEFGIGF